MVASNNGQQRKSAGRTGGVNISGHVGKVGGDIIGGDQTYNINLTIVQEISNESPPDLMRLVEIASGRTPVSSEDQRRAPISGLASRLHIPPAVLTSLFKVIDEQKVRPKNVPARLIEITQGYRRTEATIVSLELDSRYAAELKHCVERMLSKGLFAEAQRELGQAANNEIMAMAQARERARIAEEDERRATLNAVKLLAEQANVALMQLDYDDAARRFAEASELVSSHPSLRWACLVRATLALGLGQGVDGDVLPFMSDLAQRGVDFGDVWNLVGCPNANERQMEVPVDASLGAACDLIARVRQGSAWTGLKGLAELMQESGKRLRSAPCLLAACAARDHLANMTEANTTSDPIDISGDLEDLGDALIELALVTGYREVASLAHERYATASSVWRAGPAQSRLDEKLTFAGGLVSRLA
ncbi:hypothetical protein GCT13_28755 [Paraburkholderia sp. CNPSo 3157]|uniref:Uncharacterized protein n=1 Tax=Paraburkholderia franconis TaxID=2654983 RepID=A0A7X1TIU5_9BURK|nr:hypothetical protein [Paraburkholderia franconis]MPW20756.1 hypothetical protein [Paraburkholderia franconis]